MGKVGRLATGAKLTNSAGEVSNYSSCSLPCDSFCSLVIQGRCWRIAVLVAPARVAEEVVSTVTREASLLQPGDVFAQVRLLICP